MSPFHFIHCNICQSIHLPYLDAHDRLLVLAKLLCWYYGKMWLPFVLCWWCCKLRIPINLCCRGGRLGILVFFVFTTLIWNLIFPVFCTLRFVAKQFANNPPLVHSGTCFNAFSWYGRIILALFFLVPIFAFESVHLGLQVVQIDVSYMKTKRLESVLDLNNVQLHSSPLFHDKQIFYRIQQNPFYLMWDWLLMGN